MKIIPSFRIPVMMFATALVATITLGGCSPSGNSVSKSPPQHHQPTPSHAAISSAKTTFANEMGTLFAAQLLQRVDVDQIPYRQVLSVVTPAGTNAASLEAFLDCLASNRAFANHFLLVQLSPGEQVLSLSQPSRNAGSQQLPDGTVAGDQHAYQPDAIYHAKLDFHDTRDRHGVVKLTMTWRVEHPRRRQVIMSQRHTRVLIWKNRSWSLVNETN